MKGLTVRWSLANTPEGVEEALATYVARHLPRSLHRHGRAELQDLADGARRVVRGAATSSRPARRARSSSAPFTEAAADSPGSTIIGSSPVLIEACDIVAIAEGWDGFKAAPRA